MQAAHASYSLRFTVTCRVDTSVESQGSLEGGQQSIFVLFTATRCLKQLSLYLFGELLHAHTLLVMTECIHASTVSQAPLFWVRGDPYA